MLSVCWVTAHRSSPRMTNHEDGAENPTGVVVSPDTDVLVDWSRGRHISWTIVFTNIIVVSRGVLVIVLVYIVLNNDPVQTKSLQVLHTTLPDILVWSALRIPMFGIPRVENRRCHRYDNPHHDTKLCLSPFYRMRQPGESARLFEIWSEYILEETSSSSILVVTELWHDMT